MAKPSATFSKVTSALVSMCSAVSWASPKISDSAIVKQPAWAAPMSSSGFVPGLPSKRLPKPYGYSFNAPLRVEMAPLPSLIPLCQAAAPYVFIMGPPVGTQFDGSQSRSRCVALPSRAPQRSESWLRDPDRLDIDKLTDTLLQ